jgi:hypothetical protein
MWCSAIQVVFLWFCFWNHIQTRTGRANIIFNFFRETSNSPLHAHLPVEIWGMIWDNLPARVAGLRAFLESRAENIPLLVLCLV